MPQWSMSVTAQLWHLIKTNNNQNYIQLTSHIASLMHIFIHIHSLSIPFFSHYKLWLLYRQVILIIKNKHSKPMLKECLKKRASNYVTQTARRFAPRFINPTVSMIVWLGKVHRQQHKRLFTLYKLHFGQDIMLHKAPNFPRRFSFCPHNPCH